MPRGHEISRQHRGLGRHHSDAVTSARRESVLSACSAGLSDAWTATAAQAELNGIARQLMAAFPDTAKTLSASAWKRSPIDSSGGKARTMFVTIMVAVGFVLLIACANVANLLLSRSAYRAREIAVADGARRDALARRPAAAARERGARRIGGAAGLVLAVAGVDCSTTAMQASEKPYWLVFTVDRVVVGYVAAICMLTGVLFGLAPALHVSKDQSLRRIEGRRSRSNRQAVACAGSAAPWSIAELALTIVLLAGAGLMIRSFMTLYALDIGIDIDRLMTMRLQLPETKYPVAEARRAFFDRLEPRLRTIPGVEAVAITTGVPPLDGGERLLEIDGFARTSERPRFVSTVTISPRVLRRGGRAGSSVAADLGTATVHPVRRRSSSTSGWRRSSSRRGSDWPAAPIHRSGIRRPDEVPDRWRTIVGISPSIRARIGAGRVSERRRVPPVPAGCASSRVAARPERVAASLDHGRRAPGSAGDRRGSASIHHPDG